MLNLPSIVALTADELIDEVGPTLQRYLTG
ncbi:hypothetical protein BH20ACT5_BH20ACT5_10290 [soil metagenome]